jgi:hypothetical protein
MRCSMGRWVSRGWIWSGLGRLEQESFARVVVEQVAEGGGKVLV